MGSQLRQLLLLGACCALILIPAFTGAQAELQTSEQQLLASVTVKGTDHVHNGPWLEMKFRKDVTYKLVVGGEVDISPGANSRKIDAIYCFESHSGTSCDPPYVVCGLQLTYYDYHDQPEQRAYRGWNNFQCPGNAPEYWDGHAYEGTFTPTYDASVRVGVSGYDTFPDDNTGSFEVQVYGPPEPPPPPPPPPPPECTSVGKVIYLSSVAEGGSPAILARKGKEREVSDRMDVCVGDRLETRGQVVWVLLLDGTGLYKMDRLSRFDVADELARLIVLGSGAAGINTKAPGRGAATPNAAVKSSGSRPRTAATGETKFELGFDAAKKTTTVAVTSGSVRVDPTGSGATKTFSAGQGAYVTGAGVKTVSAAKARARLAARKRVLARMAKATACRLRVRRITVGPAGRNWRVTARTNRGRSVWKVAGRRVTPLDDGAKAIARNCR